MHYIKDDRKIEYKRQVIPDGFFVVKRPGDDDYAFLLELDRGTEQLPRFVHQKVRPGVVYLKEGRKGGAYLQQTRATFGRYIVVTTGEKRALHLKKATEAATRKSWFYFTSLGQLTEENFFTEPIWYLANWRDEQGQLIKGTLPLLPLPK